MAQDDDSHRVTHPHLIFVCCYSKSSKALLPDFGAWERLRFTDAGYILLEEYVFAIKIII
jgi:hypothetical protein